MGKLSQAVDHFFTLVKKLVGLSPSEYREKMLR